MIAIRTVIKLNVAFFFFSRRAVVILNLCVLHAAIVICIIFLCKLIVTSITRKIRMLFFSIFSYPLRYY